MQATIRGNLAIAQELAVFGARSVSPPGLARRRGAARGAATQFLFGTRAQWDELAAFIFDRLLQRLASLFFVDCRASRPFGRGGSRAVKNTNDAGLSVSPGDLNRCAESTFFTALFRELKMR